MQELAQGKSLAELVRSGWRADEAEAKRIAVELLTVLNYLSSKKPAVVHRQSLPLTELRPSSLYLPCQLRLSPVRSYV